MSVKTESPITVSEAAELLNISKSRLYKLTSAGEIPHYKPFGKRLYFYPSELNDFIRSKRVKMTSQINSDAAKRIEGMK